MWSQHNDWCSMKDLPLASLKKSEEPISRWQWSSGLAGSHQKVPLQSRLSLHLIYHVMIHTPRVALCLSREQYFSWHALMMEIARIFLNPFVHCLYGKPKARYHVEFAGSTFCFSKAPLSSRLNGTNQLIRGDEQFCEGFSWSSGHCDKLRRSTSSIAFLLWYFRRTSF